MGARSRHVHIDAALRSAQRVVGLGEGWAGGPQRKKRTLRRKKVPPVEADALPSVIGSRRRWEREEVTGLVQGGLEPLKAGCRGNISPCGRYGAQEPIIEWQAGLCQQGQRSVLSELTGLCRCQRGRATTSTCNAGYRRGPRFVSCF
jgi:hypothetical protein